MSKAAHRRQIGRSQIGRSVPRLEARAKVTGAAEYVHNLRLPGMLHGKIFRSVVPHARIRAIDVEKARAVPGVFSVITIADIRRVIPDPYYGPAFHDQPILADGKVRHIGEPVAVVLAAEMRAAEEGCRAITAEYDELPAVYDEVAAATSEVHVHDALRPAGAFPDLQHLAGRRDTNVALDFHLRRGDPERAFAAAERVFEHTFRTQQVMHTPLEPHVSLADAGPSGVTIHTASQNPSFVRSEIARLLVWPENRVRVRTAYLGGGFGGKLYVKLEALVTALSLLCRRPVKIALTMEEAFFTISRHPTTFHIKSAVDKDRRITARQCTVYWNGGAYADIGPRVAQKTGFTAAGPYDIENVAIASYEVYTNRPPAGALRGFGTPQIVWAYDSHTDLIARALALDPVEFRRRNLLREGRPQATGTVMRDAALAQVLERAAARLGWDRPFDRGAPPSDGQTWRRGRGIAMGFKASIAPTASVAIVNLAADGGCTLYCGTVDMGQGSDTVLAQIAGEVLDIPAETVRVVHPDTEATPYDMGTLGSRSTYHMGHAVRQAAEEVRDKLAALAAELGLPPGSNLPIPELFRRKYGMRAGNVIGSGSFVPSHIPPDHATGESADATPYWMSAAVGAEVAVDIETGQVRIERLVLVADAGTPINPQIVETQLSGAAIMQLGFTMQEEMVFEDGQLRNPSFADYKIPGLRDLPARIETETAAAAQQDGPFGAKGVGESGTFAVSPAIANAIHDAVGIRLTELPLKPEAVWRALAAAKDAGEG
jgi:CO/xanthine dehydrogenase Mo-binding subunit